MKSSRIVVLFLAVAAAGGAFVLASGGKGPPPEPVAALPPTPPPPPVPTTEDVLVAARDLPLGTRLADGDLRWQPWPKDNLPPGAARRGDSPGLAEELKGSIARAAIFAGEPVRREKLIKSDTGFMSAILPSGKRAVAINIDTQGGTSAGGFVLPNDRVDVIRTFRQEPKAGAAPAGGGDTYVSETLLTNVRVLAVGQNIQDKNGQPTVVGANATLELEPGQAETVILAQRTGQLSLVLRSLLDAREAGGEARQASHSMSVVRYGTVTEDTNR